MSMPRRAPARVPFLIALAAGVIVIPAASAQPGPAPRAQTGPTGSVALVGVTVIDPASGAPSATDQTILIVDGRIRAVGPSRTTAIPRAMQRVAARGRFAIPGLWDAHVHFMNTGETALPLLLALGVTSVREMGGYIDSTRVWQTRMRAGTLAGPRILTPGPILESPRYLENVRTRSVRDPRIGRRVLPYRLSVGDSAEAARAIDSLVRLRVDFVKVRTAASPAAYFAILREARRRGLVVAGHQPGVVSVATAVDSGQRDVEHALLPPTSGLTDAGRDSLDAAFVRRGAWYTPTLAVSAAVMLSGDSAEKAIFSPGAVRDDERRAYATPWLLEWWRMQVNERIADSATQRQFDMAGAWRSTVNDVRRMHAAGVPLLAGTDAGSVLVYPGFSLHEELRLFVEEAGLPSRSALWSATVGPARFAGLEDQLGTIAPGKIADIVLLDADPLANIRNTRRIFAVVQGGRVLSRVRLDAMLADVRVAAGASERFRWTPDAAHIRRRSAATTAVRIRVPPPQGRERAVEIARTPEERP